MVKCKKCNGTGWFPKCDCDPDRLTHCNGMGTCGTHECSCSIREELLSHENTLLEIKGFFNDYRWLSNFHLCQIEYSGLVWNSTEHAYQAAKTLNHDEYTAVHLAETPNKAKKLGKKLTIRDDWDSVKIQIMTELTIIKYKIPELREKLLATGDAYLEESNWWHDKFWGTCQGVGENHLGKIIMDIRQKIKEENCDGQKDSEIRTAQEN